MLNVSVTHKDIKSSSDIFAFGIESLMAAGTAMCEAEATSTVNKKASPFSKDIR